ncbi:MAG: ABC transporter permease [Nitrospirae bacterium]|nr:ABC transporter permease [Nitrospirota bacterium]
MFRNIWQYRQFIFSSIRNELVLRFTRSKMGGLWMIIHPLSQVAIYALIFSNLMAGRLQGAGNKYAYTFYLMAGLLGWTLFNEIISRCLNLFIENGNLMKKVNFPRITLICIMIGSCLLNNIMLLTAILGIFALLGHNFSIVILLIVPLTLTVVVLAAGIGLILGITNVFMRDIGQIMPIILQIWFFLTPIVYPESIIPAHYRQLMNLNPMYTIIASYHQILAYNSVPQLKNIAIIAAISLALAAISLFMFRRASSDIVDVL